jgi:hypothetical protein
MIKLFGVRRPMNAVTLTVMMTLASLAAAPPVFAQTPKSADLLPDPLGTIILNIAVDTALVVIDDDFSAFQTITPFDSVLTLPVGNRKLTVATRLFRDYTLYIEVQPDTTRVINLHLRFPLMTPEARLTQSSWPRLTWDSNLTVHTDPGTEIYVEGQHVGHHRAHLNLPAGTYRVRLEDGSGRSRRSNITVNENRLTVADLYVRPERSTFFAAAIFPGAGQLYRGDPIFGAIAFVSVAGLTTAGVIYEIDLRNSNNELEDLRIAYRRATDERLAWDLGNQLEAAHGRLESRKRTRDILLGAAAGAYFAQLVDALRPPRGGFRQPIRHGYLVSPTVTPDGPGVRIRLGVD